MEEVERGAWFTQEQIEQNRKQVDEALAAPPPEKVATQDEIAAVTKQQVKDARVGYGQAWLAWQDQCRQRKEWIAAKQVEWRKRLKQREFAINEWNNYVDQAKLEYNAARDTAPPSRPT